MISAPKVIFKLPVLPRKAVCEEGAVCKHSVEYSYRRRHAKELVAAPGGCRWCRVRQRGGIRSGLALAGQAGNEVDLNVIVVAMLMA